MYPSKCLKFTDNVIGMVAVRHTKASDVNRESGRQTWFSSSSPGFSYPLDSTAKLSLTPPSSLVISSHMSTAEKARALYLLRRRRTQQRYRQRIQDKTTALEKDVAKVQEQIQQLEERKLYRAHLQSVLPKTTPWNVIVEYCHVLRRTFEDRSLIQDPRGMTTPVRPGGVSKEKEFLQAVMTQDVMFNGGFGVEAMLEHWRLVSHQQEKLIFDLRCVEYGSRDTLVAHMNTRVTITANMVHTALPQLANDKDAWNWAPIAVKLAGKQLQVKTTVHFEWNEAKKRITSVYHEADMLTPLLKLLGNLKDVAIVLDSTLNVHHWGK